jgi:hypothetical protein
MASSMRAALLQSGQISPRRVKVFVRATGRRDFKSALEQTQQQLGQSRSVKSGADHEQSDLMFGLERRQGRDVGRESRNNQQMYWHETRGALT